MKKLVLYLFLIHLLPFSSHSFSQTIWNCEEIYYEDGSSITECKGKDKNILYFDIEDPEFSLKPLGKNFIANLKDESGLSGKLTGTDGKLILEAYGTEAYDFINITVEVNYKFEYIGKEISINYPEQSSSEYRSYQGEYLIDNSGGGPLRHGSGKTVSEFEECSGIYSNDDLETGTCNYYDGSKYSGNFAGGDFSGYGEYFYKNGDVYKGFFKSGERYGKGKYLFKSGDYFEGIYADDKPNGFGYSVSKRKDAINFIGFYVDGIPADGTWLTPEGRPVHIGKYPSQTQFQNGTTFVYDDNEQLTKVIIGKFDEEFSCNEECQIYESEIIFDGEFSNGYPAGLVKEISGKNIITGVMDKDYLFQGNAVWQSISSDFTWEGNFDDGLANGEGVAVFKYDDDRVDRYKASWTNGKYNGELNLLENEALEKNRRIALVVGNNKYISNPLSYAVQDSRGIASILRKSGFEVIHIENASQDEFYDSLTKLKNKIKMYGTRTDVLFYYAGHAAQVDGINYLNPVDTVVTSENQLEVRSVNMNRVFEILDEARGGVKIAILDACRNNPFSVSIRSSKPGLAQMLAPRGTFIAFSTGPGQTAIDSSFDGYGIYTGSLIQAMQKENITIEEVFKETRKLVVDKTSGNQVPWDSSSLITDFYFISKD